jgi:hypothetical protein
MRKFYAASCYMSMPYSFILFWRVFLVMPRMTAVLVRLPPVCSRVLTMVSRSISFREVGEGVLFPACWPARAGGRPSSAIVFPLDMITIRSTMFSSSRTLPGQLCCMNACITPRSNPRIVLLFFSLYIRRKCSARRGISSLLSLKGGMVMGTTLIR